MSTSIIVNQESKMSEQLQDEEYYALLEGMVDEPELADPDLADPDAPNKPYRLEVDFADTDDQAVLLGAILQHEEVLAFAADVFNPDGFTMKGARIAGRVAVNYWKKYQGLPPKWLVEMVAKRKMTESKDRVYQLAHISVAYMSYHVGLDPAECVKAILGTFSARWRMLKLMKDVIEKGKNSEKIFDLEAEMHLEVERIKSLQMPDSKLVGMDALEFFKFADARQRQWLIDGWIAEGTLHLLDGHEKAGKSTLVHSMIPALVTGEYWFGKIATKPCHVLYLDYENPPDYVRDNLLYNMPREDWEAVASRLSIPTELPFCVSREWLLRYMEKNKLLGKPGVVFIDSAIAAFNGLFSGQNRLWENNQSDVRAALKHTEDVARQTGWAVVIVHHQNKTGGTGGSMQWGGGVDLMLSYNEKDGGRVLSAKGGRWSGKRPISLVFAKPEERLVLMGDACQVYHQEDDRKLEEVLDLIPSLALDEVPTEGNTITEAEVRDRTGLSNGLVSSRLKALREKGLLQREKLGEGNKSRLPWRYWRCASI